MSIDPDETPHAKAFWEQFGRQSTESADDRAARDRVEREVGEAADALSAKAQDITRRNAAGAHLTPEQQISEMTAAIAATGFPADEVLAALDRPAPDPYARSAEAPEVDRARGQVLAAMRPGVVISAKHRDPGECGGTEHRWMVLHSEYGRGPGVVSDTGQHWALSSLDPATIRVVTW